MHFDSISFRKNQILKLDGSKMTNFSKFNSCCSLWSHCVCVWHSCDCLWLSTFVRMYKYICRFALQLLLPHRNWVNLRVRGQAKATHERKNQRANSNRNRSPCSSSLRPFNATIRLWRFIHICIHGRARSFQNSIFFSTSSCSLSDCISNLRFVDCFLVTSLSLFSNQSFSVIEDRKIQKMFYFSILQYKIQIVLLNTYDYSYIEIG